MKVSVAVMAHPRRAHYVEALVTALDAEPTVIWDRHDDRWDTGRRSLLAYDPSADRHLVVQDDALVCRDLVAGCTQIATAVADERPVGLYLGKTRATSHRIGRLHARARARQATFIAMHSSPLWGVGLLLPTAHIEAIVSHGDRAPTRYGYDTRIASWYIDAGIEQLFTVPSLVDHRSGPGYDSLVPGRSNGNRVAYRWLGAEISATTIRWTTARIPHDYQGASR